jgi:hypothetical protein
LAYHLKSLHFSITLQIKHQTYFLSLFAAWETARNVCRLRKFKKLNFVTTKWKGIFISFESVLRDIQKIQLLKYFWKDAVGRFQVIVLYGDIHGDQLTSIIIYTKCQSLCFLASHWTRAYHVKARISTVSWTTALSVIKPSSYKAKLWKFPVSFRFVFFDTNIIKYLLIWIFGKQYVLWSLDCQYFFRVRLGKHRQSRDHKTYCFPWSQSISVKCIDQL